VTAACERAAEELVDQIQPWAWPLFAQHRDEGRLLVLATTSPAHLCEPLGEALGFDGVVATRYRVDPGAGDGSDPAFDGTVDGHFVWGKGKLAAVEDWAKVADVDLDTSYAYSDSYYDTPLLGRVGHPVAVNPDPRLLAVAQVRRWPVVHLDAPPGVPKLAGVEPQQALLALMRPELVPYARFELGGLDHLPADGPAIVAANHRSYFDVVALAMLLARMGRPARFLGKREVFDAPIVGQLARSMGGIRVDRGSGSTQPLAEAAAALDAGELVVILPQGTIPRGPAFFSSELVGRPGVVRLARMTGAPVHPVGVWGTERVWPRSLRFPNVANVLDPPLVTVRAGAAVELAGDSVEADLAAVMGAIADLLPEAARHERVPTPDELARTHPPGWVPDAEAGPA
jgi:putative phosphoserine phosphatase/1-acylglycerol-3-phosphate O-acyltransferase